MKKLKLLRITTIPLSLNVLLKGQLSFLNNYFEVIAVSGAGKDMDEVREREGVTVRVVEMEREIAPAKDVISLKNLVSLFKKERPSIVHANTPKGSLLAMMAAKFTRVPVRIYTVTGLRFEGFPPSAKRKLLVAMERLTCACATHVIPEGNGVRQALIDNKITSKPLKVVSNGNINGIDTSFFDRSHFSTEASDELREDLDINAADFVFCFIGRLVKDKGIVELTKAFKKIAQNHPSAKLLLIGPFEAGDALPFDTREEIENNHRIIITGFISDIRPYLTISDVFVFPSYREGFPNVVMQAGAMELPCIVTNINGSNEIIKDGENGIIIPSKNEEALYKAMSDLIHNHELREKLSANSREMIRSRYEQKVIWEALLERYNEYLCEKKIVEP